MRFIGLVGTMAWLPITYCRERRPRRSATPKLPLSFVGYMFFASTPGTYRYVLCGGATEGVAPYRCLCQPKHPAKPKFTKTAPPMRNGAVFKFLLSLLNTRYREDQRTMIKVPSPIRMQPIKDLTVNCSCNNTKARTNVMTTLNLSMGTTLEAWPICNAL